MGSVLKEISRLETAKQDIETAIEYCGVNVPDTELIDSYANYIRQIPSAVFSTLDADLVGGTDKFISSIKQTNGIIEATAGGLVSTSASGLAPKIGTAAAATITTATDEWVLTSTKGATPTWRKLPVNAFENNNTTYTFTSGNGGFTVTPSGGTAQTVSIGNIDSSRVNALTNYSKATTISSIVNTDTLNVALGKLEYKLDFIYNDLIGGENNANIIDKWSEIKDFIAEVGSSTDITDEFVTRKTALTVTGLKTFIDNIIINTTAANKTPKLTLKEHYTASSSWISEIVSDYYGTNVCATENFTHGLYIILGRQLFDNLNILDSTKTPIARISKEKGHWFDGTLTASSFIKSDSSNSYVLLGGGGHKLMSTFFSSLTSDSTNAISITICGTTKSISKSTLASSLGSLKNPYALTVFGVSYDGSAVKTVDMSTLIGVLGTGDSPITDSTHLLTSHISGFNSSGNTTTIYKRTATYLWSYIKGKTDGEYVTALGTSGNYVTWTKNGTTNNLTVPYATKANKLNSASLKSTSGLHYYYAGGITTSTDNTGEYVGPSSSTIYSSVLRLQSHTTTGALYYRDLIFDVNSNSIWSRRVTNSGTPSLVSILHSDNSSVSKSGQTLTVKINGVELSLTNTTYSSLKNPYAIKFKNTAGTEVSYDGSAAVDLTSGVNYATNADTLDGLHLNSTTRNNEANKVMRTDGNGYANFGWINTTSGVASGTITRIYCSLDSYVRYLTPANTLVAMISTLSEGTSNVTDNTEILTSYASNNGFADTNAPNVVYKRDALCIYNYIKGKLDSVYQAKGDYLTGGPYLPLIGGTLKNGTERSPLILDTTATSEVGLRLAMSGTVKSWIGYSATYGTYLYNSTRQKYLNYKDDGILLFEGNTVYHSGNLTKSTLGLGNVQNTAFYQRVTNVNGTAWNMAGTTNSAAFTIYAPTTVGNSGQVLTSAGTGAPGWTNLSDLSVGTATNAYYLSMITASNPSVAYSDLKLSHYFLAASSGYAGDNSGFPVISNANSIVWMGTHSGKYGGQLGISSNGRMYYRFITNNSFPTTANGGSWNKIAWTSDLTWSNISGKPSFFSGNYNDLTNKPTIPTKVSQLTNDSGFLISHLTIYNLTMQAGAFAARTFDPNGAAQTVNIPAKTSHLINDSGFLTSRGYIGTTSVLASSATLSLTGIGSISTAANNTYDLGASGTRWKTVYAYTMYAATAFYQSSDRTLKTNIQNISKDLLDRVYNINEVSFNWKDSGKEAFGYIALDYEAISKTFVDRQDDGTLTLDYTKALVAQIAALKLKIVNLEERLHILERS